MQELATSLSPPAETLLDTDALAVAPPTPIYTETAQYYGYSVHELLQVMLYDTMEVATFDGESPRIPMRWIPGHCYGTRARGPRKRHDVMAIGKMPGVDEMNLGYNFVGRSGQLLRQLSEEINYPDINDWYVTNVVRYLPPDGGKTLKPTHVKDCRCLLAQEIALIRPKLILIFGADAAKAVCGKDATLSSMRSNVFIMRGVRNLGQMPQVLSDADELVAEYSRMKVLVTIHPAAVLREDGLRDGLKADLVTAKNAAAGVLQSSDLRERDYTYTSNPAQLGELVDKLILQGLTEFAVDCEWGASDFKMGSLRSIQFSWAARTAVVVKLLKTGGAEACDYIERHQLIDHLRRLLCRTGVKLIGHNFRADAKRLQFLGLPVMENLHFDTMLADHILNENAEHGLEACAVRYTDMGRYDWPMVQWMKKTSVNKKYLKKRGFLDVPEDIFDPYSAQDADCNFRVYKRHVEMLNKPENVGVKWCFDNVVMPCNWPLHEIEMTGLVADRDRMVGLVKAYDAKKVELLAALRNLVCNERFNPRSYPQCVELLFKTLALKPYKTTEKHARMWEDVLLLTDEQIARLNPAVDAETMEALAADDKSGIVEALRDFRIIDQMTKSFLRMPMETDARFRAAMGTSLTSDDIDEDYEDGLVAAINSVDGRVHTNLSQTSETGRQKSSDPNMQNLPKKQDKEFARIMGEGVYKIRSCFIAAPGSVIIEADYKSAEIYTLGYLSNCFKLIHDADSDLHARGAVNYFNAPAWDGFHTNVKPPKEWLKEFKSLRVGAKTVNFGIPYQRGAKAVARQIVRETKGAIECTGEMAQKFIDGFYATYPEVRVYVDMCKKAVTNPGFISNAFGRRRRFFNVGDDRSILAACQREAVNMPIQGTVADTLNVALYNLYYWRQLYPGRCDYKILLAVHDAVLIEVPGEQAHIVVEEILPQCMKYGAIIPSWKPVATYPKTHPFTLDIDIEVCVRWGETASAAELRAAHVPGRYVEEWTAHE